MLRFIVVPIILLIGASAFGANLDSSWTLTSNMDDVKVWLLKSNPDVTGAYQTSTPKEKIDWKNIEKEKFFKGFEADKKRSLSLIGVKEWKATNYEFQKRKDGFELIVEGSYIDSSQQKISFKETQIYKTQKTFQILNTWPSSVPQGEKLADEFVSDLKKENKDL